MQVTFVLAMAVDDPITPEQQTNKKIGVQVEYGMLANMVCSHQSPGIDCKCGITWFCHEDEDFDSLRKSATKLPEKYRETSDDAIGWGWLNGHQVVWGCGDCMAYVKKHEDWILDNEELVRSFLVEFGKNRLDEAKRLASITDEHVNALGS